MRIDFVSMPKITGKTPAQALQELYRHCEQTAVLLMEVNNKVEDLERKVSDLENQLRQRR